MYYSYENRKSRVIIFFNKFIFNRMVNEIESNMRNFNNIFNFFSIEKLREIIQEEADKKNENNNNKNNQRKNNNFSNTNK